MDDLDASDDVDVATDVAASSPVTPSGGTLRPLGGGHQTACAPVLRYVADGNFHVMLLIDPGDEDDRAAQEVYDRLVDRAIAAGGTCTSEHGVGLGKRRALSRSRSGSSARRSSAAWVGSSEVAVLDGLTPPILSW